MSSPTSSSHSKDSGQNRSIIRAKAKEVTSEATAALITTLTILKESLDGVPVPGLKAAVGGVLEAIKAVDKAKGNAKDIAELRGNVERLNALILESVKDGDMSPALETRIDELTKDLQLIKDDYEKMTSKGRVRQFLAVHDHATTISGLGRMLNRAIQSFLTSAIIEIEKRVGAIDARGQATLEGVQLAGQQNDAIHQVVLRAEDKTEAIHQEVSDTGKMIKGLILSQAEQDLLNSLPYTNYRYDSASRSMAPTCLKDTRTALLAEIFNWIDGVNTEKKIYWLHGLAGTGKSTIAHTVAERLAKEGRLGASIFFTRDVEDRRDALRVLPAIAHQLAELSSEFKKHLVGSLAERRDAGTAALSVQMEKLIVDPLRSLGSSPSPSLPSPVVVVMDALDECEQQSLVTSLLKLMSEFIINLPNIEVKVFITSRPEQHIIASFKDSSTKKLLQPFVLHDIETSIVQADIESFIRYKLEIAAHDFELTDSSTPWPSTDEIQELVQRAGALFIVASTSIKFITDPDVREPKLQLRDLLSDGRTSGISPYEELDHVYLRVLTASVGRFTDPNHHVCIRFRDVVGAIITARDPLSSADLRHLLGCDIGYLAAALERLRSVIIIPSELKSSLEPLRVFHLSFPNFLTERCSDPRFTINPVLHHSKLALHCLRVLNTFLKRDICGLSDAFLNSEIPNIETELSKVVLPHHKYACRHWGFHLHAASQAESDLINSQVSGHQLRNVGDELLEAFGVFCKEKLLQWMELLSLLGWLDIGVPMLKAIEAWLMSLDSSHTMLTMLKDGQRLLLRYFRPIQLGASQVYHSALAFMPYCTLYENYKAELDMSVRLVGCRETAWDPCMCTLLGHTDSVSAVAFSHDSTLIISGSVGNTTCIWDPFTGSLVRTLETPGYPVASVAFSHDSALLATGVGNHKLDSSEGPESYPIHIRDTLTGSITKTLEGHKDTVSFIAFSCDSAVVISSDESSICLWDVETGSLIKKLGIPSGFGLTCMALSYDSKFIASGHWSEEEPEEGHPEISMVCIWNTMQLTGSPMKVLVTPYEESQVRCVTFSHDGTLVAVGSYVVVDIWDAVSGSHLKVLEGHNELFVKSIEFSHDDTLLVCGSHKTICLWDVASGSFIKKFEKHTDSVTSVAFSHDSTLIISASDDHTVCIWDTAAEPVIQTNDRHPYPVRCIAFSHDFTLIVSGSSEISSYMVDCMDRGMSRVRNSHRHTCIWNAVTGSLVKTLEGHTNSTICVNFSYDNTLIISGSYNHNVYIWDVASGSLLKILEGHNSCIDSVAFSHDNTLAVCISSTWKKTLCVWDAVTKSLVTTLDGHTLARDIRSIAFCNENRYVLAYDRQGRCVCWDFRSNTITSAPAPVSSLSVQTQGLTIPQSCLMIDGQSILGIGPYLPSANPSDPRTLCHLPVPSSDVTISQFSNHHMAFGTKGGDVYILDFSKMCKPF